MQMSNAGFFMNVFGYRLFVVFFAKLLSGADIAEVFSVRQFHHLKASTRSSVRIWIYLELYRVAGFYCGRLHAKASEVIDACKLDSPMYLGSIRLRHIRFNPHMRIGPFDFRNDTVDRDLLRQI